MPTHAQKKVLRYTPEQMYALVADVRRYPEFLPWCAAARIIEQNETSLVADMTIGFKLFRETFRSEVTLDAPREVQVFHPNLMRPLQLHFAAKAFPEHLEAYGHVGGQAVLILLDDARRGAPGQEFRIALHIGDDGVDLLGRVPEHLALGVRRHG